jgi:succinate dehydrogenase flavin-adding protein (antitoxin of CptAB toxin-antitoxin module)
VANTWNRYHSERWFFDLQVALQYFLKKVVVKLALRQPLQFFVLLDHHDDDMDNAITLVKWQ